MTAAGETPISSADILPICDVRVVTAFFLNFVCSPLIVVLNKWIYTEEIITSTKLVAVHFLITFLLLNVCLLFGVFQFKRIDILKLLPLASTFCGFVALTNLSLQYNTVGTSQLFKSLTTPCIIVLRYLLYGKTTTFKQQLTVIPIAIGVFLNSYYDVKFNIIGIVFATIGVLVTSLYQVWVGEKQHEFQVNSMQLLFYQAPLSAVLLMIIIPFIEPVADLRSLWHVIPLSAMGVVLLSGLVAFLVNLSIYWIIGNTSPVTYNMVGHLKFCLTLLGGYVLFSDTLNFNQVCGIITTISGVMAYTHFKMKENKKAELPTTASGDSKS